jgi:hypothetical protein
LSLAVPLQINIATFAAEDIIYLAFAQNYKLSLKGILIKTFKVNYKGAVPLVDGVGLGSGEDSQVCLHLVSLE